MRKRQVNRSKDMAVVEESEASATFYVAYPGLYLTYDTTGRLIESRTPAEWERARKAPAKLEPQQLVFQGGLRSPGRIVDLEDDDVPF